VLLAGCVFNEKEPNTDHQVYFPYRMEIKSFKDARIENFDQLRPKADVANPYPFKQEEFLNHFRQAMNHNLFVTDKAQVHIKLAEYRTLKEEKDYQLILFADISAVFDGETLFDDRFSCLKHSGEQFMLKETLSDMVEKRQFTMMNRDDKIFEQLMAQCAQSLAQDINLHMLTNQTAD
tara:strand:- start:434 stop:967 length:534 start_codon:yes stop_codon:yes gene_type:complete